MEDAEMLHTIFRNWDTSIDNRYIPTCYTISVENNQNAGDQPELNHGCRVTMGGHCSLSRVTCHVSPSAPRGRSLSHQIARRKLLVWSGPLKYRYYKDHTHITFKWHNNGYVWLNKCLQPYKHNQCPLYLSFRSDWGLELELWRIVSTVDQDVDWRG